MVLIKISLSRARRTKPMSRISVSDNCDHRSSNSNLFKLLLRTLLHPDFIAVCVHVPVVDGAAAPVAPPPVGVLPEKSLGLARRTICSGAANVWWRMWKTASWQIRNTLSLPVTHVSANHSEKAFLTNSWIAHVRDAGMSATPSRS